MHLVRDEAHSGDTRASIEPAVGHSPSEVGSALAREERANLRDLAGVILGFGGLLEEDAVLDTRRRRYVIHMIDAARGVIGILDTRKTTSYEECIDHEVDRRNGI